MLTLRLLLLLGLLWGAWEKTAHAQLREKSGFILPMNLPLDLAGSFSEPRPNHFHSGIDIKTGGKEGEPVHAVYQGYISRIRISSNGYGKAIYINHRNGYTSVYAHLSRFNDVLEKYVHQQHYARQSSELDIYPGAGQFNVMKGTLIAYSGNTGGSSAPHLHFEIRDSKTENALNPLDFYPKAWYQDTLPPQLHQVKIHAFGDDWYNNATDQLLPLEVKENYLTTSSPIRIANYPQFALSLEGYDKQDTSRSKNGIDIMEVHRDDSLAFRYQLQQVDFSQTSLCNLFVDYHEMETDRGYFYALYQLKQQTYPIYSGSERKGHYLNDNDTTHFQIYCRDYNSNTSEIRLTVYRKDDDTSVAAQPVIREGIQRRRIELQKRDTLQVSDCTIYLKENTFPEPADLDFGMTTTQDHPTRYTLSHSTYELPLLKPLTIRIKAPDENQNKQQLIVRELTNGKTTALKTTLESGYLYAESKALGTFSVVRDTIPPVVEWMEKTDKIRITIKDKLSGISAYKGYIGKRWVNFYYDAKNDLLEYTPDEYCPKGEHWLRLIVTDKSGNTTEFKHIIIH